MASRYDELPAHKAVDKRFEDNYPQWEPKYRAMDELRRFLEGDRYVHDGGAFNKDRRGVQIRGQDIQDTIRHVVAKTTEKPRSVEGRPKDQDTDPEASELFVALVTDELSDPWKGFEREYYAAIQTCREMRLGIVWMDLVPNYGPYGSEIFHSWQAPDRVMWEAPYHPHHPLCGWFIRDMRLDTDLARAMYKAPWLEPDKYAFGPRGSYRSGSPLISGYTDRVASMAIHDDKVTLRQCWYKNDQSVAKKQKYKGEEPLKPDQRYLTCAPGGDPNSGCGFRSDTQQTMQAMGVQGELPGEIPGGCPGCGGDLKRIDALDVSQSVLAFANGRRLVITAPFSPNPKDEPVADRPWPVSKARSFPALFLFSSVKPGDVMGPCDVDWMWDQQVGQDNLDTLAIQRVFEHRNYWEMPENGFNDYRRKRFEFRNDQHNVIFKDMTKTRHGQIEIKQHSGTGLDPAWGLVRGVINQNLTRYRPVADIGVTEGQANDVPVGTTQLRVQQSETSTNDFVRRCHGELGMYYGLVSDYIAATYTPERLSRLNIDGADHLVRLAGQDLPNLDFVVSETPDFTGLDKEKAQAFDQAMQVGMQMGPEALDAWAQFHNVPRTVIRTIQKLFAEKQQQAQEQMAQAGGQGPQGAQPMPGMEAPGPPPNGGQPAAGVPSAAFGA